MAVTIPVAEGTIMVAVFEAEVCELVSFVASVAAATAAVIAATVVKEQWPQSRKA